MNNRCELLRLLEQASTLIRMVEEYRIKHELSDKKAESLVRTRESCEHLIDWIDHG